MENAKHFKKLPEELILMIWNMVDPDYMRGLSIRKFMPNDNIVYETYKNSHYQKLLDIHQELDVWWKYSTPSTGCHRCSGSGATCSDCSITPTWQQPVFLGLPWDV